MTSRITRRGLAAGAIATTASITAAPGFLRAQAPRELVIVSFAGQLQEPHRWLADRMEKRHPGLKIRLVPSESQDVVAQIKRRSASVSLGLVRRAKRLMKQSYPLWCRAEPLDQSRHLQAAHGAHDMPAELSGVDSKIV